MTSLAGWPRLAMSRVILRPSCSFSVDGVVIFLLSIFASRAENFMLARRAASRHRKTGVSDVGGRAVDGCAYLGRGSVPASWPSRIRACSTLPRDGRGRGAADVAHFFLEGRVAVQ